MPLGAVAEIGLDALQWHVDSKTAEAVASAKEELRQGYSATTEDTIERRLFAGLTEIRTDLESPAATRNALGGIWTRRSQAATSRPLKLASPRTSLGTEVRP